jgi:hypothetical protein
MSGNRPECEHQGNHDRSRCDVLSQSVGGGPGRARKWTNCSIGRRHMSAARDGARGPGRGQAPGRQRDAVSGDVRDCTNRSCASGRRAGRLGSTKGRAASRLLGRGTDGRSNRRPSRSKGTTYPDDLAARYCTFRPGARPARVNRYRGRERDSVVWISRLIFAARSFEQPRSRGQKRCR